MSTPIILIDANNFYASCEQAIDPALIGKPVVVLSNNDGCIIARSSEARGIGIHMGEPYFKVKDKLKKLDVKVRSSNYELYGDISRRLMMIIEKHCDEIEIYSIDEAFARIKRPKNLDLRPWAQNLRAVVYQSLSISISIGIGSTKVLAKVANNLAKNIGKNAGIFDIELEKEKDYYLESIAVNSIWGVGKVTTEWFHSIGIKNALLLRDMPVNKLNKRLGIVGVRLQYELKGIQCITLNKKQKPRKEICVSRSFCREITNLIELRESIIYYIIIACQKLRKLGLTTDSITIFTHTSRYKPNFYYKKASIKLEVPTNSTNILLTQMLNKTSEIYNSNKLLVKAGVIMKRLSSEKYVQQNIFTNSNGLDFNKDRNLNKLVDKINNRYGNQTISWGAHGTPKEWAMKRNKLSNYTSSSINRCPVVWA